MEAAFLSEDVAFTHVTRKIADGTKPDFVFPSLASFESTSTPRGLLTFVGAKTSAKERWMQLVTEGHTVHDRYMATMDRDLNSDVLTTMGAHGVIPVLPSTFVAEHYDCELPRVISFQHLIEIIRERQGQLVSYGYEL